jgi:hypothetical protein
MDDHDPLESVITIAWNAQAEIKQASKDLRSLAPDSALADLVDARVRAIESRWKHRFG